MKTLWLDATFGDTEPCLGAKLRMAIPGKPQRWSTCSTFVPGTQQFAALPCRQRATARASPGTPGLDGTHAGKLRGPMAGLKLSSLNPVQVGRDACRGAHKVVKMQAHGPTKDLCQLSAHFRIYEQPAKVHAPGMTNCPRKPARYTGIYLA